jgi:carboxypeptidase family protein/TonB-dependent receptor-like protein
MRYVAICIALLVSSCAVFAQTGGTGSIRGEVTDPSGAVVSGADVDATNTATGSKTDTVTTDTGLYVIPLLLPGTYTVTVSATGFESLTQQNVVVDALATVTLNEKLTLGAATQYVTVSSQPTMLHADDVKLGQSIDNDVYDSLPLAMANNQARDPAYFSNLVVGVTDSGFQSSGTDLNSYNGGQQFQNEIYIEGLPITSAGTGGDTRNVSFGISVEAIDQFQVATTGSEAMYEGQGVSNFVVKSGTNQFHGGLFEYLRNTDFDARSFFNTARPVEHQNEFGGTVGGPVLKNKLFFFGSYDGYRFNTGIAPVFQTAPTPSMQMGDFSQLLLSSAAGGPPSPIAIYNNTCTSGGCSSVQFQCPMTSTNATNAGKLNIIPGSPACPVSGMANPISAVSQSFQSYLATNGVNAYFASAYPSGLVPLANNYLAQGLLSVTDQDTTTEKVDYNINEKNRLFVDFTKGRFYQPNTGSLTSGTSYLPVPYIQARTNQEFVTTAEAHETMTFSPSLVNDFGYIFSRLLVPEKNITAAGDYPTKAGLTNLPAGIASTAFPVINFSGTSEVPISWAGTNANASTEAQNTYTLQDNLLWTKNRNHFTFGFQWQALEDNDNNPLSGSLATFNFANTETTQIVSGTPSPSQGNAYASFLLGLVDSSTVVENTFAETGGRYKDYAPYVQDDIKLTQRLQVNIGLRWDVWSPYTEQYNRTSFFNPNITNPVAGGIYGGLQFAGYGPDSCSCTTVVHTDWHNFGPRIGIAYRINNSTVLRAFYGIFYAHAGGIGGRTDARQGLGYLGYTYSNSLGALGTGAPEYNWQNAGPAGAPGIPGGTLAPPFINPSYGTGAVLATAPGAAAIGSGPGLSVAMNYADPLLDGIPPDYQDITFGVEHSFGSNMSLSVTYSGSLGRHLAGAGVAGQFTNQLSPAYLPLGPSGILTSPTITPTNAVAEAAVLRTDMTNFGIAIPSWAAAGCTVCEPFPNFDGTYAQALKPYPQYLSLSDPWADVGNSEYQSVQASFNKRMSRGLSFTLNYTFSKELDDLAGVRYPGLDSLEYAPGAIDRPQVASAIFVWHLPFGGGHKMGSSDRVVSEIVEDWQLSGIFTYAYGAPLSVTATCQGYGIIDASCYPNIVAGSASAWTTGLPAPGSGGLNPATTHYLNSAVFSNPPNGTYGDATRMAPLNLYGPDIWDVDMSVRREFPIHEQMRFALQLDAFNVFNIVNFANPTTGAFSGSGFGEITSQQNKPRELQLSARFSF